MTKKRITTTIPMVKHKHFTITRLGTRTGKEFQADIAAAVAEGYKVYSFGKTAAGVQVQMGKTEEWDLEDFLTEVREMLDDC